MSDTDSSNIVKQYSSEIPKEVKSVAKALDDDVRLAIIIALMKNSKMSFSELKRLLKVNSSSLSHHLSILQNGGLIDNLLELKKDRHSYYIATEISKSILESLFDIIVRPRRIGFEVHNSLKIEDKLGSYRYEKSSLEFMIHTQRSFESPSSFPATGHSIVTSGT
jgi:DNA-binding transcriptional ArsR family regulator